MTSDQNNVDATTGDQQHWKPSFNPWIIAFTVILPTFMEILDTSVANVAIPHMAGSFSATYDEATWVLTSYLVSNAIILPSTAWFCALFGRKRFLMFCIALFTFASFLCGVSTSIDMLIIARILQGIGGGTLQPVSQAILLESFPPSKVGVATAVFGFGVVFAPIIGPTLGGWITDSFTWRWIFYINIPIGIIAILLCHMFIEDPPYIKKVKAGSIDYIGFGVMAIALAGLQIILDRGQQSEWFDASWIRWFAAISAISLIIFIIWELRTKNPLVNLRVLKDRNFAVGTFLIFVIGSVLYGTIVMLSLFLQNLMHYTAELSGFALSPRGIGSIFAIIIAGRLSGKVDNRILITIGLCILSISCFMLGNINLQVSLGSIIIPNTLSGVALGFIFIPLMSMAFSTLQKAEIGNATGIFNLMRNIGGSIGISMTTSLISHNAQVHQAAMVHNLTPYDPVYQQSLSNFTHFFMYKGSDIVTATQQGYQALYGTLVAQANLFAFVDNFRIYALIAALLIPLLLLFKRVKAPVDPVSPMH